MYWDSGVNKFRLLTIIYCPKNKGTDIFQNANEDLQNLIQTSLISTPNDCPEISTKILNNFENNTSQSELVYSVINGLFDQAKGFPEHVLTIGYKLVRTCVVFFF